MAGCFNPSDDFDRFNFEPGFFLEDFPLLVEAWIPSSEDLVDFFGFELNFVFSVWSFMAACLASSEGLGSFLRFRLFLAGLSKRLAGALVVARSGVEVLGAFGFVFS